MGLIISIFSLAQLIFAPINGTIKNFLGQKNAVVVGFLIMTACTFGLGALIHINNPTAFKVVALILRFFQGQGDTLLQVTGYSIVTNTFNSEMLKYIGYIEICVGLGLGLGPLVSAVILGLLKYELTLYVFGVINIIGTLLCLFFLPGELNVSLTEEEQAIVDQEVEELKDTNKNERLRITWCTILRSKTVMCTLLACFVGTVNLNYWSGYLANVFKY